MRRGVLFALLVGLSLPLQAHTRSASYAQWTLDERGGSVQVRVSQLDLSRLELDPRVTPAYAEVVADRLTADLQLWSAEGRCRPGPARVRETAGGWMQLHWRADCEAPPVELRTRLLEAVAPSHLHFVRVRSAAGLEQHRVLGFADPVLRVGAEAPPARAGVERYLTLGVLHILGGWDHLLFLLMLLLLARGLRERVWTVSVFTLAHSITLVASVLGWVQVREGWVEGLIAWSILLLAAENLWQRAAQDPWIPRLLLLLLILAALIHRGAAPLSLWLGLLLITLAYFGLIRGSLRPQRLRLGLAFAFGLIHGFGFAGELLSLSLPREQLAMALLGFNLGVELGQLLMILLFGLLWWGLGRADPARWREAWIAPGLATLAVAAAAQAWWLRMVL